MSKNVSFINKKIYKDDRGSFQVVFESSDFQKPFNCNQLFHVNSSNNVFRGMHMQLAPASQNKIFTVLKGAIIDFTVCMIPTSSNYLHMNVFEMKEDDKTSLFIPKGFAHGYYVTSEDSIVQYAIDKPLSANHYISLNFKEHAFQLNKYFDLNKVIASEKDRNGMSITDYEKLLLK